MRALVIVDIQHSMGFYFSWSYLMKVRSYLMKHRSDFSAVFMVMEPKFQTNERGSLLKPYAYTSDSVPLFFRDFLSAPPFYKAYNQDFWGEYLRNPTANHANIKRLESAHNDPYDMYLNKGLRDLLISLSSFRDVTLIGGGYSKCVWLTKRLLESFGKNVTIINSACYDIRIVNSNRKDKSVFTTKVTKTIPQSLTTPDGYMQMWEPAITFSP